MSDLITKNRNRDEKSVKRSDAPNENVATNLSLCREQLIKSSTLHWFHWFIISLSLMLTIFAWYFSQKQVDEKVTERFKKQSQQVLELVVERLKLYEEALWAGAATLQSAGGDIDYHRWKIYAENLNLLERYPGINGIGVIHQVKPIELNYYLEEQRKQRPDYSIYPNHNEDLYMPISYIIPLKGNEKAVGLDMAHESNRFQAAIKAKRTGSAQITGPITLVQDRAKTPGFLFYVPFYQGGSVPEVHQREEKFNGLVYAPFIVKKLMSGVLSQHKRQIAIRISDQGHVLYNELVKSDPHFDENAKFKTTKKLDIFGRTWVFELWSDKSFGVTAQNNQPMTILIGGLTIDALLLSLFIAISRGSKKALVYAAQITDKLEEKTQVLRKSNEDLNKFAYIASHDLRAPLRGIDQLASWVLEDDEKSLADESKQRLKKIKQRIGSMHSLINGILEYSRAGNIQGSKSMLNLNDLLEDLEDTISSTNNIKLEISNPLPTMYVNPVAIGQVFSNLITNAVKHTDKDSVAITIDCHESNDYYYFSVKDDGPGIKEEFQEKVFHLFQTLEKKEGVDSSGVGLAIVAKIIESANGSITLASKLDDGCIFEFSWPKEEQS